jgi:hypothetical protein
MTNPEPPIFRSLRSITAGDGRMGLRSNASQACSIAWTSVIDSD